MREIVIDTEMSAVMTLEELQTTADEASPDDDRHNDNGVHADRIDNVWGESGHGRSAPLQPRPSIMTMTRESLCELGHTRIDGEGHAPVIMTLATTMGE